jgi:hypothetical protein
VFNHYRSPVGAQRRSEGNHHGRTSELFDFCLREKGEKVVDWRLPLSASPFYRASMHIPMA